jgi:hypothetical protein
VDGVVERDGGEYVCQVSTIGQLIATSFHLDIQGMVVRGGVRLPGLNHWSAYRQLISPGHTRYDSSTWGSTSARSQPLVTS